MAALLYVLRCLPALFAPSGLIGITLVFFAGGAATILLLVTTAVRHASAWIDSPLWRYENCVATSYIS